MTEDFVALLGGDAANLFKRANWRTAGASEFLAKLVKGHVSAGFVQRDDLRMVLASASFATG